MDVMENTTLETMLYERRNCSDLFNLVPMLYNDTDPRLLKQMEQAANLDRVHDIVYMVVIPTVCVFGFFGNILNVIVFLKKKTCKTLDEIEYCTTVCLVALAVSDMMFCLCTFPQKFNKQFYAKSDVMQYYRMYSQFAINTFMLSSTMLTVLTAIMRYTVICHPFYSRQYISYRKTLIAILAVFLFSFAFNAPYIWRLVITDVDCSGAEAYIELQKGELFKDEQFVYALKLLWAIVGNFFPLISLLYCNIRLVKALHESQKLRLLHSRDNVGCLSAHRRINITLITIIILFFVLVAPSEISKFISEFAISNQSADNAYTYHMVSMITNALQCINFSINFILYYVIIAPFRRTLHEFVCVFLTRRGTDSTNSHNKQQTCVLLIKEHRRPVV